MPSNRIELIGLPGSGKTTVARALIRSLRERFPESRISSSLDAVRVGLRRRDDGLIKNTLKRLPPWVWERFISARSAIPELLAVMAERPELWKFVLERLDTSHFSFDQRHCVLGAFFQTAVETRILEKNGPAGTVLMEEGFCHRAFSLFGYREILPPREEIERFAQLIPLPKILIRIDCAPDLCDRRCRERDRYPFVLQDLSGEEQLRRFGQAAVVIDRFWKVLEPAGILRNRLDAGKPLEELGTDIAAMAEWIAGVRVPEADHRL